MPRLGEATRAAREARILRAAVTCFARRGYYGATMEDIAAEAGISKGAAYVHFPSKEAIFLTLYDDWGCTVEEETHTAIAALPLAERRSPRAVLRAIVESTGRHVQDDPRTCRVLMEAQALAAYVPAIAARVIAYQDEVRRQLETLVRAGVEAGEWPATTDAPTRAMLIWAALHGLMATWHVTPGAFDWHAAAVALSEW